MLHAIRHHIKRAIERITPLDLGDCVAEMQSEDDALDSRLRRIEERLTAIEERLETPDWRERR